MRTRAPGGRGRQRRPLPVLRQRRGEHRLRPTRGERASRSNRPPGAPRRTSSSRSLPQGYDTQVGERGLTLSGRAAPAAGDRAGAAGGPAGADPGRRHLLGGRLHRAEHQGGARRGDGGSHDVRDRPPPLDDRAGRRDRGARPRPTWSPRGRTPNCCRAPRCTARSWPPTPGRRPRARSSPPASGCSRAARPEAKDERHGHGPGRRQRRPTRAGLLAGRGPASGTASAPSRGNRGRNLRGLLALLAPYRTRVAAMLFALVLGTCAALAPPLLAGSRSTRASPSTTRKRSLFVVGGLPAARRCSCGLTTYAQTYLVGWVGQRALADLRIRIFTHLQSQPIGFYESRPAGVLISRMTNDVEALESLVTDSVVTLFQAGLTLIGAIAVLLYLDPKLALLTFCVVPFVAGASIWFRLVSTGAFRRTRETIGVDHRLPAGDAVGHPRGPQLRPGARPRGALRRAQRGQPRGQHDHRPPQRRPTSRRSKCSPGWRSR